MRLLLILFSFSLVALLAAAWAIARAVRRHGKPVAAPGGTLNLNRDPAGPAPDSEPEPDLNATRPTDHQLP
jgi:hypothetical protein